jgi:uncharacterized protein involved in exopolysaccharide biosynthesis
MKFTKLESMMHSEGIYSLADIARTLDTTPQAVSNWKARDQVPYHVVDRVNREIIKNKATSSSVLHGEKTPSDNALGIVDIIVIMAQQFKILFFIPFVSVFISFTYVQFIDKPVYKSSTTILLPENKPAMGNLGGLASQLGLNMGATQEADLSSPSLFPDLLKSRMFAERILKKEFYFLSFGESFSLDEILNESFNSKNSNSNINLEKAIAKFRQSVSLESSGGLSQLSVVAVEPELAKEINSAVLNELQILSKIYKSQKIKEKINFIENRINQVRTELEKSEQDLKIFRQQNQQLTSPSLLLQLEQITREKEIQKGIFLTLKQQFELAKIEEIQEASVVQVLDLPNIPLYPINKNIKLALFFGLFFGLLMALSISFIRAYFNTDDILQRKKIRRGKNYFKKKIKDLFLDYRITGTVSVLLLLFSPFYFGYRSQNPIFFGMYSFKLMLINVLYLISFITVVILFIRSKKIKAK